LEEACHYYPPQAPTRKKTRQKNSEGTEEEIKVKKKLKHIKQLSYGQKIRYTTDKKTWLKVVEFFMTQ
jgi:hypothetical protein